MKLTDLFEYITKDGQEVDFTVEGPTKDRYWTVIKFIAKINGNEVGHLTTAYIPSKNNCLATIWHYQFLFGRSSLRQGDEREFFADLGRNTKSWPLNKKIELAQSYYGSSKYNESNINEVWTKLNKDPTKQKLYKNFKDYWIDKPHVDYIRTEDGWSRNYLALIMYQYAAKWLYNHLRLPLYSSDTQTDEAQAAWQKMKSLGWTHDYERPNKKSRLFIVGNELP